LARTIIPGLKCRAGMLTDYVATRWYRAPELLLSWRDYDEKGSNKIKQIVSN